MRNLPSVFLQFLRVPVYLFAAVSTPVLRATLPGAASVATVLFRPFNEVHQLMLEK